MGLFFMTDKKRVAIIYDADFTLIKEYHQNLIFRRKGIDPKGFWDELKELEKREKQDGKKANLDIIYLALFMHELHYGKLKGLSIDEMRQAGKDISSILYPGLPEFFKRVKDEHKELDLSHNIVSMGFQPLLESAFGDYVDLVEGYGFLDFSFKGGSLEVSRTVSSLEKDSIIRRISMGGSDVEESAYQIKNMVYIGDGKSDIPAFKLVRSKGGGAICVFDESIPGSYEKARLFEKLVDIVAPADFRKGSAVDLMIRHRINTAA